MCGIAGIFGRGARDEVAAMTAALVHRGPDDGHVVGDAMFALGARRLAIQDVHRGREPLSDDRQAIWAVLNGEIYNYPDLAHRLRASGRVLHTHCDTEVLPHLYAEEGPALAPTLDGMFAVAVWDTVGRRGLLARDRMGKKPIYWTLDGGALCFASELKALLRLPGFERRLNLQALDHYLSLKHVPHPLTIFEGVHMLPPGHTLTFEAGGAPRVEPYWSPDFSADPALAVASEHDLIDELIRRLGDAVERRLLGDVPIGFFLSGGIDSSLVTALAAERVGSLRTFSLTYADQATTPGKEADRTWARWVAAKYGTGHHEETLTIDRFPETLPAILDAFDEPFAGVTSTWHLSRAISKHVKVAMAGDGADELFGSYLSHRLAEPLAAARGWRPPDGLIVEPLSQDAAAFATLRGLAEDAWRPRLHVFTGEQKRALYSPEAIAGLSGHQGTADLVRGEFADVRAGDPLNRVLEMEFRHQLPDQVLTFVDRLSMAHSLEVRAPFLDTAVVTFVGQIPGWRKMPGGRTKHLLKQAALRVLSTRDGGPPQGRVRDAHQRMAAGPGAVVPRHAVARSPASPWPLPRRGGRRRGPRCLRAARGRRPGQPRAVAGDVPDLVGAVPGMTEGLDRPKRIAGILQPGYLPWLGFFEQLHRSDVFVLLDDVQYDKHSWRNRNRIKTAQGVQWLTVPVLTHGQGRPLTRDVRIDANAPWRRKHLEAIRQSYRHAPFADWTLTALEPIYARDWERLLDLDLALLQAITGLLDLGREIVLSSSLDAPGERVDRLIAICRAVGATGFYEGAAGRDYIDPAAFAAAGVDLEFQDYRHPEYPQQHGPFVPHLSIVDLLCNRGPGSLETLIT